MGTGGIALAGTLAFTAEALLLLWLLKRSYPTVLRSRDTLLRVTAASALGGLAAWALVEIAPIPALFAAMLGLVIGTLISLPFILPELKEFAQLGRALARPPWPKSHCLLNSLQP
jgi:peptidoglycan biosynthesis protein MviN/MurJ (putative lipid II flippase)